MVRLLEADEDLNAMLLERCEPGTPLRELPEPEQEVVIAGLAIDPKPFVGDRAYDATQHLLNCRGRMMTAADSTISRFADLLEVDAERVRLWMFARAAAEPRDGWTEDSVALARALG